MAEKTFLSGFKGLTILKLIKSERLCKVYKARSEQGTTVVLKVYEPDQDKAY